MYRKGDVEERRGRDGHGDMKGSGTWRNLREPIGSHGISWNIMESQRTIMEVT